MIASTFRSLWLLVLAYALQIRAYTNTISCSKQVHVVAHTCSYDHIHTVNHPSCFWSFRQNYSSISIGSSHNFDHPASALSGSLSRLIRCCWGKGAGSGRGSLATTERPFWREQLIGRASTLLPATPQHFLLISSHLCSVTSPSMCNPDCHFHSVIYTNAEKKTKKQKQDAETRGGNCFYFLNFDKSAVFMQQTKRSSELGPHFHILTPLIVARTLPATHVRLVFEMQIFKRAQENSAYHVWLHLNGDR